jgi:single-strand DNA-binding protein
MASLNKVQLIGHLGADPELRHTGGGTAVCDLSIATTERWTDKQSGEKHEKTEWHKVVFFGRQAEVIAEYLRKGRPLYVEGRLQTDKYEKDGITRYSTKIIGSEFQLFSDGNSGDRQQGGGNGGGQRSSGGYGTQHRSQGSSQPPTDNNFADDEIPF